MWVFFHVSFKVMVGGFWGGFWVFLLYKTGHLYSIVQLEVHVWHLLHYRIRSCGLVFNVKVVSTALCMDNPVSSSPFQIPFSRLLVLKYTLSLIRKLGTCQSAVFCAFLNLFSIECLLAMAKGQAMHFQVKTSRIWVIKKAMNCFQQLV